MMLSSQRAAAAHRALSEMLERRRYLTAQPVLVKDVNQTTEMLNPGSITVSNGVAFFAGQNAVFDGLELWKTNGTKAGTLLVKDINPGLAASTPGNLTDVNGTLFFTATDPTNGVELWKSNGTAAGTTLVKDIATGTTSSSPANLINVNGTLFFSANNGTNGVQLWKSDGTAAGTVQVVASGGPTSPAAMANLNGTLFFAGTSGGDREVWKSNGTAAGTVVVSNINTSGSSNPTSLTVWNNAVYFNADPGSTSRGDLYTTDGTTTTRVKQINLDASDFTQLLTLTPSGNTLYFIARNTSQGTIQLWKSDGTDAGTIALLTSAPFSTFTRLQPIGTNSILFANTSGAAGSELWSSSGTVATTTLLKDVLPGTPNGFGASTVGATAQFVRAGTTIYFNANKADGTQELWKTDGTAANTLRVSDPLNGLPAMILLGSLNTTLLFTGLRFISQGDLWKSDGTAGTTVRVGATSAGTGLGLSAVTVSNYAGAFFRDGETMYFTASDGISGNELWKTDAAQGAIRVTDIEPGAMGSDPAELVKTTDGTIYFSATTWANGRELYKLTTGGVVTRVSDVNPGAASTDPRFISTFNNLVYFRGTDSSGSSFLYRYDPAAGLTAAALNSTGGTLGSPSGLVRMGSISYFSASTSATGQELWRTDGTQAGTVLVKDINPGSSGSFPTNLYAAGTDLYFSANNGTQGTELWFSSSFQTVVAVDLTPGSGSTDVGQILSSDANNIVFAAGVNGGTRTLWRWTFGSNAIQFANGAYTNPRSFTRRVSTNDIFFLATDASGAGVFRMHGTAVTRLFGGTSATITSPNSLYVTDARVFAIGRTGPSLDRFELWRAFDGAGTQAKVADVQPFVTGLVDGSYWPFGMNPMSANSTDLYFPKYNPTIGIEPYRVSLVDPVGSISGRVFDDVNGNGVREDADAPIAGTTVYLDTNNDAQLSYDERNTVTDASGNYAFTDIENAAYRVRILVPVGTTQSTQPATGRIDVTVTNGGAFPDNDFGVTKSAPPLRSVAAFRVRTSQVITIAFNADVSASLVRDDIQIVDLTRNNQPISTSAFTFAKSAPGSATTATWSTLALAEGNYRLTLPQNSVTSVAGNLPADCVFDFFFLVGDANHDRHVDNLDVIILLQHQDLPGTYEDGDFDFNGIVEYADSKILIPREDIWLPPQGPFDLSQVGTYPKPGVMRSGDELVVYSQPYKYRVLIAAVTSFSFDGAASGGWLTVYGWNDANSFTFNASSFMLDGLPISYTNMPRIDFDGGGGGDSLTINAGSTVRPLRAQSIASLTFGPTGKLDLADNDLIVTSTPRATIENYVRTAYNFGGWDGPRGIFSSTARDNPTGNTTLGLLSGQEFNDNNGGLFNGISPAATDVLVKYTYFGDVDFNGSIDASDYNLIDFGFVNHLTGWANGDADYSGGVDASDYNVIDFAFATQSGVL